MMPLDTTVDHRLIDGGAILRFTSRLVEEIENMTVAEFERPIAGKTTR
jgi:pyruvate/2-oxoglutarate dehydrogenase complex dihydrolipoamide acyltransferase (E2) component